LTELIKKYVTAMGHLDVHISKWPACLNGGFGFVAVCKNSVIVGLFS
jgi:hypothetical protein